MERMKTLLFRISEIIQSTNKIPKPTNDSQKQAYKLTINGRAKRIKEYMKEVKEISLMPVWDIVYKLNGITKKAFFIASDRQCAALILKLHFYGSNNQLEILEIKEIPTHFGD
jgi:hypothetical protein